MNERHKSWTLSRLRATKKEAWRPKRRHRQSVAKWLARVDLQLGTSSNWEGLAHVKFNKDKQEWAAENWRRWPQLALCQDQGPDGMSAIFASQFYLDLNIWPYWDWQHGAMADLKQALRDVKVWPFIVLVMLTNNLGFGPERDECLRFAQMQEALKLYFEVQDWCSAELFLARAPAMLREMGDTLVTRDDEPPMQSLWNKLKADHEYPKLGHRTKLCQFMGFQKENENLLGSWTERLWKAEVLALEHDLLTARNMQEKVFIKSSVLRHAVDTTRTDSSLATADNKLLRSSSQNGVVISVQTLSSSMNKRTLACITWPVKCLRTWAGKHSADCRSSVESAAWMKEQIERGFHRCNVNLFGSLTDIDVMTKCDFLLWNRVPVEDMEALAEEDDLLSMLTGEFVVRMVAQRCKRLLYTTVGWPHRILRVLLPDPAPAETMAELRDAVEVFEWAASKAGVPAAFRDMVARSPFQTVAGRQLIAMGRSTLWQPTAAVKDFAQERVETLISSLPIEEQIHYMKNCGQIRGSLKARRPERSMGMVVGKKLMSTRYRFSEVQASHPVMVRNSKLKKKAFRSDPKKCTMSLKGIAGSAAKAPYVSTTAANYGRFAVDQTVLKHMMDTDDATIVLRLGSNVACDSSNPIVFKHVDNDKWYHGLCNFKGGGCMAWEVKLVTVPEAPLVAYVDFVGEGCGPVNLVIDDWRVWVARPVVWRSWSFLNLTYPALALTLQPGVRLFTDGPADELATVFAKQGWCNLDVDDLDEVAKSLKLPHRDGDTLFSRLQAMTLAQLGCDAEAANRHLRTRLVSLYPDDMYMQELVEVDEAAQMLEREDQKEVEKEKKTCDSRTTKYKSFAAEYLRAVQTLKKDAPKAKKPRTGDSTGVKKLPADGRIKQADARKLLPPGGKVWKSRDKHAWCARTPPMPTVSRSWDKWTEKGALFRVVQAAWIQHCELEGILPDECEMGGVFNASVDAAAEPSLPAGSSTDP